VSKLREPIEPPPPADLKALIDRRDESGLLRLANLWTRAIIGIIGIVLPLVLIAGEAFFLRGGVHVRGSLSAYYHTSMRDLFVASLCVTGFFLATYMAGTKTWDFWLKPRGGSSGYRGRLLSDHAAASAPRRPEVWCHADARWVLIDPAAAR
jgi:hypothetical protein